MAGFTGDGTTCNGRTMHVLSIMHLCVISTPMYIILQTSMNVPMLQCPCVDLMLCVSILMAALLVSVLQGLKVILVQVSS